MIATSAGLASNLALTLPLAVFVFGGVFLWGQMERWIDEARRRDDEAEA